MITLVQKGFSGYGHTPFSVFKKENLKFELL
jgi:hypothetical protein